MAIRKSSNTGIPFGNTANRPANPAVGQPYFNGQENRLEIYTQSVGWQNIVAETPGVVSYTGTVSETNSTSTIVISGTNFNIGAIASLIGTDGTEYAANTTTVNSIVQITAVFPAISASKEPYDLKVVNPSNLYGILPDSVVVNDKPVWTTASGSLGTFDGTTSVSTSPLAVSDEENNTITYSLLSGSLPGGLSLNSSTGVISGTATNPSSTTTYSFTLGASDGSNIVQQRTFSITINTVAVVTGGTLTSDATYYYRTFTSNGTLSISATSLPCEVLMVAGGGPGGGQGGSDGSGGGGAGGLVYAQPNLSVGSYSLTVGGGGSGVTTGRGSNGIDTTFPGLTTAVGGGAGSAESAGDRNGANGGSGGGGGGYSGGGSSSTQTSGNAQTGIGYGNGGAAAQGSSNNYANGGGGGAGQGGQNTGVGGNGLNTWSSWIPISALNQSGYIAGGGGSSADGRGSSTGRNGGLGGGGKGSDSTGGSTASSGVTNTGSGGGGIAGTQWLGSGKSSGNGGSGLIVVRYTRASVGG